MVEGFVVDDYAEPIFGAQLGKAVLTKTHSDKKCKGEPCVIHNPTEHHMRSWPLNWRSDRKLMERVCSHGIGHPDPDDLTWHLKEGRNWQSVHGCDGCCA